MTLSDLFWGDVAAAHTRNYGRHWVVRSLQITRFSISLRNMPTQPELKPSDLIEITGTHPIPAIVASDALDGAYEVVYLDETGKAVAEEVQWVDGEWKFLHLTPRRIDVENLERFQRFVKQLREPPQT